MAQIRLFSTLKIGYQFASIAYANSSPGYCRKQRRKIFYHVLLHPKFAREWFALLKSPALDDVFSHRARLYIKPFRPYISIRWNKARKVKVILDTYRFIKSKGNAFGETITGKDGIIITKSLFGNQHNGYLKLGYHEGFRKEGELVLSLESDELGGKVVAVSFSFEESADGKWACIVGCVQGPSMADSKSIFKSAQKLLHGIRPTAFIIYALQELSRQLGCQAIYCAGDSIQANRRKHAINLPIIHRIHFNYDKFWNEVDGQPLGNGWFGLPLVPEFKNLDQIPSNKRSMYRKRYEMLDEVSMKIANTFRPQQADS